MFEWSLIILNHMWPQTIKPVISHTGVFVAIANNTLYGSKLLFYAKIIIILNKAILYISYCKYINIHLFFWLVIFIAKNLRTSFGQL